MPVIEPIPANWTGPDVEDVWARFASAVEKVREKIERLPAGFKIKVKADDGRLIGEVAAEDLKQKFAGVRWSVTTADSENGGVGAIESSFDAQGDWTGARARVEAGGLKGYGKWLQDLGLFYLALHETSHVTALGLAVWRQSWQLHLAEHGTAATYPASSYWRRNEQAANAICRAVAQAIDVQVIPTPNPGFPATWGQALGAPAPNPALPPVPTPVILKATPPPVVREDDKRLDRQQAYQHFHIGIYVTLGVAVTSGALFADDIARVLSDHLWLLLPALFLLGLAGGFGGLVASAIPKHISYEVFAASPIGLSSPRGRRIGPQRRPAFWESLEHWCFWLAMIVLVTFALWTVGALALA